MGAGSRPAGHLAAARIGKRATRCCPRNPGNRADVDAGVTEQQRYRVIDTRGDVEVREYAPCVVADIVVAGSVEQAGNTAFRPLVSYISKASLAMTAPVIQQAAGEERWTVSFVLPGDHDVVDYPDPTDPRVTLRAVPVERAAALRWSGRWSASNVAARTLELEQAIADAGWVASGPVRWARFDPPWKPAFARRNEIVVPVRASGDTENEPTVA